MMGLLGPLCTQIAEIYFFSALFHRNLVPSDAGEKRGTRGVVGMECFGVPVERKCISFRPTFYDYLSPLVLSSSHEREVSKIYIDL